MIRAGLSYGDVMHGSNISIDAGIKGSTKKMLLFGKPLIDAALVEHALPPFAIGVHIDSHANFADITLDNKLVWFSDFAKIDELRSKVINYYAWHEHHKDWVEYPKEKNSNISWILLKCLIIIIN